MRLPTPSTLLNLGRKGVVCLALATFVAGCMPASTLGMRAERYRIEVALDPASHELVGTAILDLKRCDAEPLASWEAVALPLILHPSLKIRDVRASGARLKYRLPPKNVVSDTGELTARCHNVVLAEPADRLTLFVKYEGKLYQDVEAGEIAGQIHNREMKAHVSREGIYLGGGQWYPRPAPNPEDEAHLADYTLVVGRVPGMELVAGAESDRRLSSQTGALAWRTPYPIEELTLAGGAHKVHRGEHNGVAINVHLEAGQARHAVGLMDAVRRNLDRYEPLIGPYPGREYSIVSNFFSSGFAFPFFTLLDSTVINMGTRSQTAHGYLDHEMLHCWWGNGVHVDPRDGNWCEALASYGANYYGYVLDGDEENARRKRRNYAHFLSRMTPERDKPLGTFGLDAGCGRDIGYHKGAAVFHMLARKMGQDTFWEALRRFDAGFLGKNASWEQIREVCEEVGGRRLDTFFRQWVRRGGAPTVTIRGARYDSAASALVLDVAQSEPPFDLDLPVRVTHADGTVDLTVAVTEAERAITVPIDVLPLTVEADPDYHIFRKIPLDLIVPTTAATRFGDAFICIRPAGEVNEAYRTVQNIFERSFEAHERLAAVAGEIDDGALAERCVLILGDAGSDTYVAAFLGAIEFPVRCFAGGFEFDGTEYTDAGDAVLCTARHPGVAGGGVTLLYANSDRAIPKPFNVPMYDHSLVIFRDQTPTVRRDFEPQNVVPVASP